MGRKKKEVVDADVVPPPRQAGKKLKCPVCGTLNQKDNTELYKNRYYCKECATKAKQEAEEKQPSNNDWEELYNYIVELYGHKPTGMMFKQLGEYRRPPYNYTNKGMYLTLKYFYEIKENQVMKDTGLGIIPYIYEEAKKNYIDTMEICEYNQEFTSNEKPIFISVHDNFNGRRNTIKPINFDDIDNEG